LSWLASFLLIFGGLMVLMMTGLPVAFCFLLVNLIGAYFLFGGEAGLWQLTLSIFSSLTSFTLLPLPLFVLMGEIMYHSGVGPLMMDALDKLLGRLPGRLGLLAVGGGSIFATLTGTSTASVAMLGSVLVPEMEKRGYKKSMSLGPILGSGGLAIMIPPSGLAVLFGALGRVSIGETLIAIIMPGLLMATLYATYIVLRCRLQPSIAPPYEVVHYSLLDRIMSTIRYILPIGFVIFMVIGVIFAGIASPTEAAATGALGTFILAIAYRRLKWALIKKALLNTIEITVFIFLLIAGASGFSQVLAMSGASKALIESVMQLPLPPIVILIFMQIFLLILGMFMECASIMMITIPLYMPIVDAVGFNPVWFAVIYLLNMEMAVTTPPFGVALFVMKGVVRPDTTMMDIYKAGLPFLGCDLIAMGLIISFPAIALWLPSLMR
jgi:tripartite ATP-independent transporter DctM subunit